MKINKTIQNLNRIGEIIAILLKYGFEEIVASTALKKLIPKKERKRPQKMREHILLYSRWERIRMAVEELGPTFIKFAQLIGNRPDLIPEPLITEFEKLYDNVAPFSVQLAKKIIEKETKKKLDQTFSYFHDKPFASASIGQAHRARLHTGEEVIVKIQRPSIGRKIFTDIEILRLFAELTSRYLKNIGFLNATEVIDAFESSMKKELLFISEAKNIQQFRNYYNNRAGFFIPKAYLGISTNKVLVVDFVKGCRITDVVQLARFGISPKDIARKGLDIYMSQIFEHGFFHADPHPGNVLVREDGVICLIDFGSVGKMIKKDKFAFANIFSSMAEHDSKRMADSLRKLATEDTIKNAKAFEYEINEVMEEFSMLDRDEASFKDLRKDLQNIIYKHKMKMPEAVFLIFKVFVILENIGKTLDPEINLRDHFEPYQKKLFFEENSPKNILNEISYRISQFNNFLRSFPVELNHILHNIRKGELHIQYEIQGLEPLLNKLDKITNRITLTLLIAAIILASAIVMLASINEAYKAFWGIPYVSLVGFIIAVALSFLLFILSVKRKNGNSS